MEIIKGNEADLGMELNFIAKKQQHRSYLGIYCAAWHKEMNQWVCEEEKAQRWVWRKTCLYRVLGGRPALCLHPGVMGHQLPAESVEGKRARVKIRPLAEGAGWIVQEKHPFLLLASNCNGVPQKKSSRERREDLQTLAGPHPWRTSPSAPFHGRSPGLFLCRDLLREKDQGTLCEINP